MAKPTTRFHEWIERSITTGSAGTRLPSDGKLAEAWHISERTVRRKLGELAAEGRVVRIQGKGTFVPSQELAEPSVVSPSPLAHETIVVEIVRMVSEGKLRVGDALPQIKNMSLSFRINPGTVIKGYRELQNRGIATKLGKRYVVGLAEAGVHGFRKKHVYFFNTTDTTFRKLFQSPFGSRAIAGLERELLRHGCVLHWQHWAAFDELSRAWLRGDSVPSGLIVGFLRSSQYDDAVKNLQNLIKYALPHTPSIVIYADSSKRPPPGIHQLCYGNIGTHRARRVARFLFEHRAQSMAVVYDWNTKGSPSLAATLKIIPEALRLNPQIRVNVAIVSEEFSDNVDGFISSLGTSSVVPILERVLRKHGQSGFDTLRESISVHRTIAKVWTVLDGADFGIFAQDELAAKALEYARSKGVGIPGDISIIGLQNSPDFLEAGLSCCVEDWDGIGYLMAHAVIGDIPLAKTHKGFLSPPAAMLERSTTPAV